MKGKLFVVYFCMISLAAFADSLDPAPAETGKRAGPRVKMTPEQRAARRAARAKRFYERTGGFVQQTCTGKVVRVVNTSAKIDNKVIDLGMMNFRSSLDLPVEVVTRAAEKDPRAYLDSRAGFVIVVVDDTETPAVLVAPEELWVKVNVGRLAADGTPYVKLARRVIKEIWRASAFALGAGYSEMQPDLMGPITSVDGLDKIVADAPSPACYNMMIGVATRLGIQPAHTTTYLQACQEGWAAPPTNDIQKAIWEKVHTIPTKPLKITYDKDKQKPVVK